MRAMASMVRRILPSIETVLMALLFRMRLFFNAISEVRRLKENVNVVSS